MNGCPVLFRYEIGGSASVGSTTLVDYSIENCGEARCFADGISKCECDEYLEYLESANP